MTILPVIPTSPDRPDAVPTRRRTAMPPRHLADLDLDARKAAVTTLGEPAFRAKQISTHYFGRLVRDIDAMTDLPAASRARLTGDLLPTLLTPISELACDDGATRKTLWRLHDGALVESVLMGYPDRVTACVSSQAGCGMACPFCATGQQGLTRNLSIAEIVDQVVYLAGVAAAGSSHRLAAAAVPGGFHGHGRAAGQLSSGDRGGAPAHRARPGRPGTFATAHNRLHRGSRARYAKVDRGRAVRDSCAVPARPR